MWELLEFNNNNNNNKLFIVPKAEYYSYLQVVKLLSPDVYCSNRIAVVFNAGLSKSFQVGGW